MSNRMQIQRKLSCNLSWIQIRQRICFYELPLLQGTDRSVIINFHYIWLSDCSISVSRYCDYSKTSIINLSGTAQHCTEVDHRWPKLNIKARIGNGTHSYQWKQIKKVVCDITWFKAKKENLCDKYHDHEVARTCVWQAMAWFSAEIVCDIT